MCTTGSLLGGARHQTPCPPKDILAPVLGAYQRVQRAGKTRFIGVSAMDPHVPSIKRIMESGQYDTVLAYYNLLNWTA